MGTYLHTCAYMYTYICHSNACRVSALVDTKNGCSSLNSFLYQYISLNYDVTNKTALHYLRL